VPGADVHRVRIHRIERDDRTSYRPFSNADELEDLIENDLALMLTERFAAAAPRAGEPAAPDEAPPPWATPLERGELTLTVRDDLELRGPVALTSDAWIALGLGESLNDATVDAVDSMLRLMGRELGLERRDALALASVVVDLRITQVVNGVMGVHAVLPHGALGSGRI